MKRFTLFLSMFMLLPLGMPKCMNSNISSSSVYYLILKWHFLSRGVHLTCFFAVMFSIYLEISCPSPSLTDVAKIAIAISVSLVLSVILAAVITIILTNFCCVKKKNTKRSTEDINAEYEIVEKSKKKTV